MAGKILVIDDEEIVRTSCVRILTQDGFEVVQTADPTEGLALAEQASFDVILCDWRMPGFDGMDVVEELDARAPHSAVVMITGYPTVERATEAMKRGAAHFLAKPFAPEQLLEAVRKGLQQKVTQQRKFIGRIDGALRTRVFPVPDLDDRAPKNIAETVASTIGVSKTTSPWLSVFVLGLLAGAYIGFGALLCTTVTFDLAPRAGIGLTKLVAGAAFSLGLMLVVIAGAELFTGNNLMVSSVLSQEITFGSMTKRWVLVYVANFLGSLVLALIFYLSGLWKTGDGALGAAAVRIAVAKVELGFWEALVRGIGCNWLVCLAVWMALAARQTIGKIFAIFFPIMAFVAIGFEHCVANMYFIPTGLLLVQWAGIEQPASGTVEGFTWLNFFVRNLVPVTIGNVIGGGVFVGMSYWGAYLRPLRPPDD